MHNSCYKPGNHNNNKYWLLRFQYWHVQIRVYVIIHWKPPRFWLNHTLNMRMFVKSHSHNSSKISSCFVLNCSVDCTQYHQHQHGCQLFTEKLLEKVKMTINQFCKLRVCKFCKQDYIQAQLYNVCYRLLWHYFFSFIYQHLSFILTNIMSNSCHNTTESLHYFSFCIN